MCLAAEKKDQHCGVCESVKQKGYYIGKMFLCEECERQLIQTEPEEEIYTKYVQALKAGFKNCGLV